MKDSSKILSHPNLKIIEENIWVINNFVFEDESNIYLGIAQEANEEDWWKENNGWYKGKYLNLQENKKIDKVATNIINRFSNLFEFGKDYNYGSPKSIHRMTAGQDMFVHSDFSEVDSFHEEVVLFNTAIYHNEVLGGEIYYPELGLEYHPLKGDLIIHPGTTKYRHGVKPVLSETRYISTLWVADTLGMKIKTSGQMDVN